MCGIAGFIDPSLPRQDRLEKAKRMGEQIVRRGPDDHGEWTIENGLTFSHRRLSIIDLTPEGKQPKSSPNGRYTVTFNGEIYNFKSLNQQLKELGHRVEGGSDTATMLSAFECWGVRETINRLTGMFAFAVWDHQLKELTLVRDRFGEKPLYYGWINNKLYFASELAPLIKEEKPHLKLNPQAIQLFFKYSCVPHDLSIFQGINKLLPGHFITWRENEFLDSKSPEKYWDFVAVAHSKKSSMDFTEAKEQVKNRLLKVVEQQMISDVPLGAFLSGGVDSSLIVSLMQSISSQPVKTFSVGFDDAHFDESRFAGETAKHLGTEHFRLMANETQIREIIPELPILFSEPFADSSQLPTHMISKLTRKHVTVCLTGDGGDELCGGYTRYLWSKKIWGKLRKAPRLVRGMAGETLLIPTPKEWQMLYDGIEGILPRQLRFSNFGQKMFKFGSMLSASSFSNVYEQLVSHWEPSEILDRTLEAEFSVQKLMQTFVELKEIEMQMATDTLSYMPNDILVKVDRSAMGTSLESRAPFLDHQLQELIWSLPEEYKVEGGETKKILREILYDFVPQSMMDRPKQGFGVPLAEWLRHELKDWMQDYISDEALNRRGIYNAQEVGARRVQHLNQQRDWHYHLWDVIVFEQWCRHYGF
ncbi:MAG: asparagine synthase (glutamine-hydrolyzing) [Bdellovibrionales bacterium]